MTLLDPQDRDQYTDLLRPPAGMSFDAGVGATYSLDLDTLLTVPLHLFLYSGGEDEEELTGSAVALLDGLRKVSSRLRLYAQRGRIREPGTARRLYGLLERVAVEVEAPSGSGSFHPKVWVLRFTGAGEDDPRLRVMVLSRNVTRDPSWDLVLGLEGTPGDREREQNRALARLVRRLPEMAAPGARVPEDGPDHEVLAGELLRAEWDLPGGFDDARFHVGGLDGEGWLPPASDRLAVVSPFLGGGALKALARTTDAATDLLSRPEELLEISPSALEPFGRVYVLDDMAERADGDDGPAPARGLHAKLYLAERDGRTHLCLGSANATHAALFGGRNVEVMAELVADTEAVGGIGALMDADGLRGLLREWTPPDEPPEVDEERRRAEARLEDAREALAGAGLSVRCRREDDRWRMRLRAKASPSLPGISRVGAWPVTVDRDRAVDASPLLEGGTVELDVRALSSLTGLIAFRLEAEEADVSAGFVLDLPVEGLPRRERDAAVVRGVIRDRESFLRYLLLLLGEVEVEDVLDADGEGAGPLEGRWRGAFEDLPLLEELTRAYCRDPGRLAEVRSLLEDLKALGGDGAGGDDEGPPDGDDGEAVIPEAFLEVWTTFEAALAASEEDAA